MKNAAFAILVLGALLSGCDTSVDVTDYDQSCSVDADCVVVLVGSLCSCACTYDAIAQRDLGQYQEDATAANDNCSTNDTCFAPCEPPGPAACTGGKCTVVR